MCEMRFVRIQRQLLDIGIDVCRKMENVYFSALQLVQFRLVPK